MRATRGTWADEVGKREDALIALRRDFHRHPELSFSEQRTAGIVAERLQAAGLEVRTGLARTGVVGVLRGDKPGRTIAWRADIDALPVTELLDAPFTSGAAGVMHACGHDGHTAIAITLAEILAARRAELPGTAVFIFQPAEELLGGAKPMIEAGVLENPRVDEIYGLHLTTQIPAGKVLVRPGPNMASGDGFAVEITGRGGHGAYPHLSIDPMTAAAQLLIGLQSFVSDMARAYRAEARMDLTMGCPPVVNPERETAFVHRCALDELGEDAVDAGRPVMASDDMTHFLRERPGCYFRVGIAPGHGRPAPHHAPEFEMNEAGLAVGLRLGLSVLRSRLGA